MEQALRDLFICGGRPVAAAGNPGVRPTWRTKGIALSRRSASTGRVHRVIDATGRTVSPGFHRPAQPRRPEPFGQFYGRWDGCAGVRYGSGRQLRTVAGPGIPPSHTGVAADRLAHG